MIKWVVCGLLVSWTLSFTGCATILANKHRPVKIDNKFGRTYFSITDHQQRVVHEGITPQEVTLKAKRAPFLPAKYYVDFIGENNRTERQELEPGMEPWTVGNLLVGGLVGLTVDGATGAIYKLPKEVMGHIPSEYGVTDVTRGAQLAAGAKNIKPGYQYGGQDQPAGATQSVEVQTASATSAIPTRSPPQDTTSRR